jgi:hypothetical protein
LLPPPGGIFIVKEKRMKSTIVALALATAATLAAQPGGQYRNRSTTPAVDVSKQFVIEGPVSAIHLVHGAQYPSIEIGGKLIKVAPIWYLLESDFEIKAGDVLRVVAAPGTRSGDPYVYALTILNTKTEAAVALRDAQGAPLWTGRRAGGQSLALRGSACLDPASVKTLTGTVETVTLGAGIEHPTLVVNAGGTLLTVKIGPERILLENDFELNPGETVTVVAVYSPCCETYLALSITNAAGVTLVLRSEDGRPAW